VLQQNSTFCGSLSFVYRKITLSAGVRAVYGGEDEGKTPFAIIEVRSAGCAAKAIGLLSARVFERFMCGLAGCANAEILMRHDGAGRE